MPTLEHQQAVVVEILRRARGDAVSFEELRDAGVEFPASVVAELELAGIPLQRCRVGGELGRRASGVQLLDAGQATQAMPLDGGPPTQAMPLEGDGGPPVQAMAAIAGAGRAAQPAASDVGEQPPVAGGARPRFPPAPAPGTRRRARRPAALPLPGGAAIAAARQALPRSEHALRVLPVAALAAACVAVAALAASALTGGGQPRASASTRLTTKRHAAARGHATGRRQAAVRRSPSASTSAGAGGAASGAAASASNAPAAGAAAPAAGTAPAPGARDAAGTQAAPPSPSAPSPQLAEALEARGHALLESGSYATAAAVLNRALSATGESLQNCVQPSSEACLTYAYALYDLGRALQLGGDASAAVPVLSQRLQIDNQRPAVLQALALARAQARTGGAGPPDRHD